MAKASDAQLQAILDDDDISDENRAIIKKKESVLVSVSFLVQVNFKERSYLYLQEIEMDKMHFVEV